MGLFTVTGPRRDKDDVSHIICVSSGRSSTVRQHTTDTSVLSSNINNLYTAGQILDVFLAIYVPVFKMFIFTTLKNLALNKRTRGPDLP